MVVVSGASVESRRKLGAGSSGVVRGRNDEEAVVEGVLALGETGHVAMTAQDGGVADVDAHAVQNRRFADQGGLVAGALDRRVDGVQFTQEARQRQRGGRLLRPGRRTPAAAAGPCQPRRRLLAARSPAQDMRRGQRVRQRQPARD